MPRFDNVIFDLDGTLTDSGEGILNSAAYALETLGRPVADKSVLTPFVGPPLRESFETLCGIFGEEADRAVKLYRSYYGEKGIYENRIYDGIPALLSSLKAAGCTLVVATSKPEPFAEQIIERAGLTDLFTYVAGAKMDETRIKKDEVINYALETLGEPDRSRVVMIGDREFDVLGAKKTGVSSLGVLYGYGSREELEEACADAVVATVEEVGEYLLNK